VIELKRNPKGTVEKRALRGTLKPPFGVASSSLSSHNQSHQQNPHHPTTSSSNRRGSGTSVYDTELKTAKQHNIKIRKQIRDVDNEIQAIAKLLGKSDVDVKRILDENDAVPKSEVLKKEGELFSPVREVAMGIFWSYVLKIGLLCVCVCGFLLALTLT
jgi:hypothetical protein